MSFCIFMASRTATTSPSLTSSPTCTGTFTIRPCMGAVIAPSRAGRTPGPAGTVATAAGSTVTPPPAGAARRPRGRAVEPLQVALQLLGDGRIAVAPEDVVDRLHGDQPADRADEGREAELAPDAGHLLQRLGQAAQRVVLLQLAV